MMVPIKISGTRTPKGIDFILENNVHLHSGDWKGDCYAWKEDGFEYYYYPETVAVEWDENGEPEEWEIIGFTDRRFEL